MIGSIVFCWTLASIRSTTCPPLWIRPRTGGLSFASVPRPGAPASRRRRPSRPLWRRRPAGPCGRRRRRPRRSRPLLRLSRALRGSGGEQGAVAEQVEAGAAVHLPLQQLEAGDLTLGLAVAPGRGERGADRGAVLLQPGRERLRGPHAGGAGVGEPGLQLRERGVGAELPAGSAPAHE